MGQLFSLIYDGIYRLLGHQVSTSNLGNVQPVSWENYFLDRHTILEQNGVINKPCTRVLILSGTDIDANDNSTIRTVLSDVTLKNKERWKEESRKIERLKSSSEANQITFTVLDMGEYFSDFKQVTPDNLRNHNKQILQDIQKFHPTVIVLAFCGAKFLSPINMLDTVTELIRLDKNTPEGAKFDGTDGIVAADIVKVLRKKPSLWEVPLFNNKKCLLFKTKNIFQSNHTLLTSTTPTDYLGIEDFVPRLLDRIKLLGSPECIRILFVSGTHGSSNGSSGFNELSFLETGFYVQDCKMLGIKSHGSKPYPIAQTLEGNAEKDAILRNPLYRMMKFNVLDIQHYHKDEKGLITYVRTFAPTAIVLGWCYTKYGDVANILCKSGILAELWLKHERTSMVGFGNGKLINLDTEQTKYLHDVSKMLENNEVKHFVLFGGHGSGKTVLGVQTANIVMGKLQEEEPHMDSVLFVINSENWCSTEKGPLLQNIETMFKDEDCVKHFYPLKKLREESGIKKEPSSWRLNDVLRAIQMVCEKKFKEQRMNKVILTDESNALDVFCRDGRLCRLEDQFDQNESMYTITCVNPVSIKGFNNITLQRLAKMDEKSLLEDHEIMVRQLEVTYRNSRDIQLFYNVYQAHFKLLAKDEDRSILTGEMKQPQIDPNHSFNQDGETSSLPLGPKPTLLLIKKECKKWSDNDIQDIQENVAGLMDGNTNSFAALCFNPDRKDCALCQKTNDEYQNKDDSTIKMGSINVGGKRYFNVQGCEKDNLVIHCGELPYYNYQFENISRARKRLILIMDLQHLDSENTFSKIMKELRYHSKTCSNDECQKRKWDDKDVVEIMMIEN